MPEPMSKPETSDIQEQIEEAKKELRAAVRGDDHWRHPDLHDCEDAYRERHHDEPTDEDVNMFAPMPVEYQAAHEFLTSIFGADGYPPDTVGQLVEVFLPCLKIMVEHNWGELWRKAGFNSLMTHMQSKFERYWERTWTQGTRHPDSGVDLINFVAFTLRTDPDDIWGCQGKPAWGADIEEPDE